jgi:sialate O-acetylesterase
MRTKPFLCTLIISILLIPSLARAALRLAPLFQDHAVLQRDKPITICGQSDPGSKITITFHTQTVASIASADGTWKVLLPPMSASNHGADLTINSGSESRTLHDIVVGDVWLASGQSNMEWHVSQVIDADKEMAAANYPLIRHYRVPHVIATQPAVDFPTSPWVPASEKSVGNFSAVAYFFARDLHRDLNIPIGIINASWGGKMIEVFVSRDALATDPTLEKAVDHRYEEEKQHAQENRPVYEASLAKWEADRKSAKADGKPFTRGKPMSPQDVVDQHRPSGAFNGMIAPCLAYAFRGVIWYQGEHNTGRAGEYRGAFSAMITDWRKKSGDETMPFYFVQLPNFAAPYDKSGMTFAELREAQRETLALPNTGMAVTIDVGDPENIHPRNKAPVGSRLARIAEAKLFGRDVEWSGPTVKAVTREKDGIRIDFDHTKGGLMLKATPKSSFELAGADGNFHEAAAKAEGTSVIIAIPNGIEPVTVRYAFANAPQATLFNGEGLPASPFRWAVAKQ